MPTSRVTHLMRVWRFLEKDDPDVRWSRREDLNAPSADYNSAALTLSYTGMDLFIPHSPRTHSGRDDRMRQIADKTAVEFRLYAQPPP
jgi:hypothetical protein